MHYCARGFSITLLEKFLIGSLHDVCMYIIPHVSPINWFPSYVSIIKQLRFFKVLKSFQIKSSVTFHLVTFTERKKKTYLKSDLTLLSLCTFFLGIMPSIFWGESGLRGWASAASVKQLLRHQVPAMPGRQGTSCCVYIHWTSALLLLRPLSATHLNRTQTKHECLVYCLKETK